MKKQEAIAVHARNVEPITVKKLNNLIRLRNYSTSQGVYSPDLNGYLLLGVHSCTQEVVQYVDSDTDEFERIINAVYTYLKNKIFNKQNVIVNDFFDLIGDDFIQTIISEVNASSTRAKINDISFNLPKRKTRVIEAKSTYDLRQDVHCSKSNDSIVEVGTIEVPVSIYSYMKSKSMSLSNYSRY